MQFEWDDAKAASNLVKHEVDFDDAVGVFLDPRRLVAEDGAMRASTGIGAGSFGLHMAGWRLQISARKADARERRRYHAGDP